MMSVSIVIPTYNRSHLISRAIRSVINQTYPSWELIVVDDGSTDNTEEVLKAFLHDSRIRYCRKENSGAAESRNFGVGKSDAEFITFLDSDDEAEPSWLERMMTAAHENKASVVCCGLRKYDSAGSYISTELPYEMKPLFPGVTARFTNGGVFLMLRTVFLAVGGFDKFLRSGQHTELAYRLIPYINYNHLVLVSIMEPLIKVHIHKGPRIRFDNEAIYLGSTRILEKHNELFKKDKRRYMNYLSVAGVCGIRTGRYKEARHFFFMVLKQRPLHPLSWIRFILSNLPLVRDWTWKTHRGF